MSEENKVTPETEEVTETPETTEEAAEAEKEVQPEEESAEETEEAVYEEETGEEKSKTSLFGMRKKEKEKYEQQIEDLTDRLKRSMAEFDNFRKRTEKEKPACI